MLWLHYTADYSGAHMSEIDLVVTRSRLQREMDYRISFIGGYEALMRTHTSLSIVYYMSVD